MSETTRPILRNNSGDPLCQFYNESADEFQVQKGENGNSFVAVKSIAANNGVDIGDVTVNNGSGVNAVNIQDGGNSITVDGTVAATQSGTWNVTNISGTVSLPTGASTEATLNSVKTSVELIDDAIYTDGVGTPTKAIAIAGTDGTNPQIIKTDTNGELQVDILTLPGSAHHSPVSGNPVRIGVRAVTSNYPVIDNGDTADLISTTTGSLVTKPYSIPESDWQFACSAAITNTTDVVVKASAGAGVRNYITSFQYQNTNATATEVVIKDGSTVIWRGYAPANMTALANVQLLTPLKGSAATAVNFACITTSASVYFNAQGYSAY